MRTRAQHILGIVLCVAVASVTTGAARVLHEATAHHHAAICDACGDVEQADVACHDVDVQGDDHPDGSPTRQQSPHHDHERHPCATCALLAVISKSACASVAGPPVIGVERSTLAPAEPTVRAPLCPPLHAALPRGPPTA